MPAGCSKSSLRVPNADTTLSNMKTALSEGWGHNTVAVLVLIAEGKWPRPDAILFSDTGSEQDATYRYITEFGAPYAKTHGLYVQVVGSEFRPPSYQGSLEEYSLKNHMVPGGMHRWCTDKFKIRPLKAARRALLGASAANPVESWIGIATDEPTRMKPSDDPESVNRWPLIELGMNRADCDAVIAAAGLPIPPKSGCWFCPFTSRATWQRMKINDPEHFERALAMERNAHKRDGSPIYLPMFGSLEAVASQDALPGFDEAITAEAECVTGVCFV